MKMKKNTSKFLKRKWNKERKMRNLNNVYRKYTLESYCKIKPVLKNRLLNFVGEEDTKIQLFRTIQTTSGKKY